MYQSRKNLIIIEIFQENLIIEIFSPDFLGIMGSLIIKTDLEFFSNFEIFLVIIYVIVD